MDIDIDQLEKDCHNAKGRNDQARTAMITLTQGPNIADSLQGEFSIGDGERMAHSFDGACNHISSTEMKPRGSGKGFLAKLDMGMGIIDLTADCLGLGCRAKTGIDSPNVSSVGRPADVKCHDGRTRFPDGFTLYGYRTCTIAYE